MKLTLVNADFPSMAAVPPLGLLSLSQAVEADGHEVILRDYQLARVKGSREPAVFADFCRTQDPVLGVSASGFALPLVIAGLKELKQSRPDLVTILGGIGASGAAREVMTEFPWIDVVVFGEGEDTLRDLIACIEAGDAPAEVPGLIYRDGDGVRVNPARPRIKDLRRLGKMDFSPLDLESYQLINIISSRGCPFPCTFCDVAPYWGRRNTARPLDFITSEIESIKERLGTPPTFIFVDDTLTVDRGRTQTLCRRLGPRGLDVEWACYARASDLDEPLLRLMGESGCNKVYLGLESGSDRILKAVRKGFDVETARRVAVTAKRFIRIVQTSFVWGFPFETWDDFYETLTMMAYLTAKGVSVKANVLTPLPFSSLFEELVDTMVFSPEYSQQLHLAEYDLDSPMVDLIRKYPRIFPCFYLYSSPSLTAKYDLLRKMGLSPEHIWDLWVEAKGPVPIREHPGSRGAACG